MMTLEYYENRINKIITMAPIEAGVETLVFMLLEDCIQGKSCDIIDVSTFTKKANSRIVPNYEKERYKEFTVPDLAIVSNDFAYKSEDGICYCVIELKSVSISLTNSKLKPQFDSLKKYHDRCLFTNGLVWDYYTKKDDEKSWNINLTQGNFQYANKPVTINKEKFNKLIKEIKEINWDAKEK